MIEYSSLEQLISSFNKMLIDTGQIREREPVTQENLERAMTVFIENVINGMNKKV